MSDRTDRRSIFVILVTLLLLAMATATALAHEGRVVVSAGLDPARLEVPVGTTVTWQNDDEERRRIRSRVGPVEFDSGDLEPGESFTFTFVVEGTYAYLDDRNDDDPRYAGTIVVSAAERSAGPPPMSTTVTIVDEAFHPPTLEVATGATIEWAHVDGDDEHTVTSSDGVFNSGIMAAGQRFSQTFDAPGTYPYFCAIHPEMVGAISVSGPDLLPSDAPATARPVSADTDPAGPDPAVAAGGQVSIVDFSFQPVSIEVTAGSSLTWTNDDSVAHTVTAVEGAFDSGVLGSGGTFSQTLDAPGTYEYFCAIHPPMRGTVVVTGPEDG